MGTNYVVYDFEQVSNIIGFSKDDIEATLISVGAWFKDPNLGILFNPIINAECTLFLRSEKQIFFTSKGVFYLKTLMRENYVN